MVYLAHNRMMDRLEVLKVLNKSLLDRPGALERFQQEIRSAARLSHVNIVAAYAVLRASESLVFAMEYVPGQNLAQLVHRRGQLPVANAAYYAHQAALGLQHAHDKAMVHRDIKPNNLMLAVEGKKHIVKILDFGLAKATSEKDAETGLTKSGQILGTPDYLAPEQTRDAQRADIRADIYSLGCTLYFLLAGTRPFQESNLYDLMDAHQKREATRLDLLRPEVPSELADVVAKMMAKDPAERYQTPKEVARALLPFFKAGQPLAMPEAPPRGKPEPQDAAEPPDSLTDSRPPELPPPAWSSATEKQLSPETMPVAMPITVINPTTEIETPAEETQPGTPRIWQLWPYLATCAAAALLVLGVALVTRPRYGTIQIDFSDPPADVTATMDGKPVGIANLSGPLSLEVGDHKIEITGADYETLMKEINVANGDNPPVVIHLRPRKPPDLPPPDTGTIAIALSDPDADVTVRVDGNIVDLTANEEPLSLDIGKHELTVTGEEYDRLTQEFTVSRGTNKPVELTLKPKKPPESPPPMRDEGSIEIALSNPNANVVVTVDGKRVDFIASLDANGDAPVNSGQPLVLSVGDHELVITGEGFETRSRKFLVSKGGNRPLTVALPPRKPTEKPRASVPASEALAAATIAVEDRYKDEMAAALETPLKRQELSEQLIETALGESDLALSYAMLEKARVLAAECGDWSTAFKAVEQIAKHFKVDEIATKLLTAKTPVKRSLQAKTFFIQTNLQRFELACDLADAAIRHDLFWEAEEATRLDGYRNQRRDAQRFLIAVRRPAYEVIQKDLATLVTDPDDPHANLRVGRYRCFYREDWKSGLHNLAAGSDNELRELAQRDLRGIATDRSLGDLYWDRSRKTDWPENAALAERAAVWYRRAMPVRDLEEQDILEQRIKHPRKQFLSELSKEDVKAERGLRKGVNWDNRPIKIGGKPSPHGLFMHPVPSNDPYPKPSGHSSVTFKLLRRAERLTFRAVIDDQAPTVPGRLLRFRVGGHQHAMPEEELWQSAISGTQQGGSLNIADFDYIKLEVWSHDGNNGAHAVWVEPAITWKRPAGDLPTP